jgi:sulfatase modifying factor 1
MKIISKIRISQQFLLTVSVLLLAAGTHWKAIAQPGMVSVGNLGNAVDATGYGALNYAYSIGQYEVLNSDYAALLNAVARTDTYGLYSSFMASDARGGIVQSGSPGSYLYSVKPGYADMPVVFVTFYDALRYANWLQNGQPAGLQGPGTTETGTYTFSGPSTVSGRVFTGTGQQYALASENEWYKAAYYDPTLNAGAGGYWKYPMRSNAQPDSRQPPTATANSANFYFDDGFPNGYNGGFAVTQSPTYDAGQNYLSGAGAYSGSASYYGTFDQGGNVWEWTEAISGINRIERGGAWDASASAMSSLNRFSIAPTYDDYNLGFRIVLVPEPNGMALLGLGGFALLAWRRFVRR